MKKILLAFVLALSFIHMAWAQAVSPIETAAKQAFLMDVTTDTPLYAKDADTPMPTSSMSKMMTIYLVFEAIHDGKLKLRDTLTASEHAWKQEGSRMFLNVGQTARVEDLIRGVVIQSGNDAAVVFAEALGGSEQNFAQIMNAKARQLGMAHSHFMNATGLPDPQHYSTARDLATLGLALLHDFPEDYHYFSEKSFRFNNIEQGNRNPLLYHNDINVDGLKTGHTDIGGYGLTASGISNGRRLILVLNGMKNMQERADESQKMLDWGFREFGLYPIAKANDKLSEAKVWLGEAKTVPLVISQDFSVTLPRSSRLGLKTAIDFAEPVAAPIIKGQQIGTLTITAPGMDAKTVPLIAGEDVPRLGFFARLTAKLHYMFNKA